MMCNQSNTLNLSKSPKIARWLSASTKYLQTRKSCQTAMKNNGFVILCIVLPSIGRVPKASMKCEGIIVKCNQNDHVHSSRTLFEHEF